MAAFGWFAAAAVLSMFQSNQQAKKQERAARRQNQLIEQGNEATGRASALEATNARLQQIREARAAQATILNVGASQGFGAGTSGVQQGSGQVATQAASNIGTINQIHDFSQVAANFNQMAANENLNIMRAQRRGQTWQQLGNVALQGFGQTGGWQQIAKWAKGSGGSTTGSIS